MENTDITDISLKNVPDPESRPAYTYIVRCSDGSLYTGWTYDLERRIAAHNGKNGAKYTRTRQPVELVYSEIHPSKKEAMQREYAIKQLPKSEKMKLVIHG